jgi:hypothetical protein
LTSASCDFWRHAATIFGIGDSYPWKLQEALLGGESKLSRLHFSMIHDINSPPRHQDDIGATLDDIYTTLDDTFFRMNFASIIMPGYGKRSRKATAILPLMPQ